MRSVGRHREKLEKQCDVGGSGDHNRAFSPLQPLGQVFCNVGSQRVLIRPVELDEVIVVGMIQDFRPR